ncbi:MAG: HAMP domain-containing sensor histidine kinase [archaeon]|jgi:signal transduction histidine kinase|nr:HAMP domain-containing sensor histidine kinase [archaeon]
MTLRGILSELNIAGQCKQYGVPMWQCPQLLFPLMGVVIIIVLISTYAIGTRIIQDLYLINFILLLLAALLVTMAFLISQAFESLAEANRLKSEFVGIVSHQLRAPLSNFQWGVEYLMSGKAGTIEKKQVSYFEILKENSARMQNLVNDLVQVSRIEQGTFFLEPTPFSLEDMVAEAVKEFQFYAKAANVKLEVQTKKNAKKAFADPLFIQQVVQNLVDNAIRYTKKSSTGNRAIQIQVVPQKDTIMFEISDNGVGIPLRDKELIFQRFFRSQNAMRHETEGTGLGLYIAKTIIKESKGDIGFTSQENKGSTFWFTIPTHKKV